MTEYVRCPDCGTMLPAEHNFCPECGSILPSADAGEIDHWNAPDERKAREEDD